MGKIDRRAERLGTMRFAAFVDVNSVVGRQVRQFLDRSSGPRNEGSDGSVVAAQAEKDFFAVLRQEA